MARDPADDLGRHGGPLEQRVGEQLGARGKRAGEPLVLRGGHRHRVGRDVEEHRGDIDPGDSVNERVVGLGEQGEAVLAQSLDQPQLPQRSRAIQGLGEDAPGQALELLLATRAGQGGVADVEIGVEVGIVDPDRTALVEGHEGQSLPIAGNEVKPGDDLSDELVVVRRIPLEDHAPGHVHMGGVALQVQKGGVEPS